MARPNFRTQWIIPLYAISDDEITNLYSVNEDPEVFEDESAEIWWQIYAQEANEDASIMYEDEARPYFTGIAVVPGYYSGYQLLIVGDNPREMDNYETQYHFGMCRSAAIRKFDYEVKRARKAAEKIAKRLGMTRYESMTFGNGEQILFEA